MGIYASVYNDSYSRFIANRDVDYGAGCTIGEAGTAYFYSSKFILNSARYQGGVVISRQSSFTLMEGVEVLGNYAEVGAVFSITERSAFIINNCNFANNSAVSGGIIFALEDYDSNITVSSSNFTANTATDTLIDLAVVNIHMIDVNFINNVNTLFLISLSTIFLNNVNISSHICNNLLIGCIISSILNSNVFSEHLLLYKVNHAMEEGIIYLEDSNATFKNVSIQFCSTVKKIGTCFELENSNLLVDQGSFVSFTYNCIYAEKSSLIIKNSLFYNQSIYTNKVNQKGTNIKLGAVVCNSCQKFYFFSDVFLDINYGDSGSCIAAFMSFHSTFIIEQVQFSGNSANFDGGALYLSQLDVVISECNFSGNSASSGGGVYYEAFCKKSLFFLINSF